MAAQPKSRPQNRKRRHTEADLSQADLPSPPKKLKPTREHHLSNFPPPEFWDCLSKVWLTRRALRELDRRNQLKGSACALVPAPKPTDQFSSRKSLQRFARHGGPELSDLRGYPEPTVEHTMSSRSSKGNKGSKRSKGSSRSNGDKTTNLTSNSASETSKKTRSSNAYDANYEQCIIEKHVYLEGYEYPDGRLTPEPGDFDQVCQNLAMPRPSLSPSRFTKSDFREFKRANTQVIVEDDVMREVLPIMCGQTDIPNRQNLMYTKLESITDNTTVVPKPDFYDGTRLEDIDKHVLKDIDKELIDRQAEENPRKEPHSFIVPTKYATAPIAPNFFLEAKSPGGGADVAKRQACLDGALGARAMHKLQSYAAGKPVYDNNILSITSTYHAGNLNMYGTHVTPTGPGGSLEYHMSQLGGWNTIGDPDTCRRGFRSLRNGRVYTQEKRDRLIGAANERARSILAEPLTLESSNYDDDASDSYPVEDSQTSVDDFATYPANEPDYDDLSDVAEEEYEEDEMYADELAVPTYAKPTASKKRPNKRPEKSVSKAPRHGSSTSRRKHRSKK